MIRILQISYIHWLAIPNTTDDYSLMRHEFLDDIESFHENRNGNFDHLLICRDIAFSGENEQVRALFLALSNEQLSLKVLMEKVGLKHRPTFLENYITPASEAGFLKVLYPDKPNHPRQKYLLTAKGLALYNEIKKMQ